MIEKTAHDAGLKSRFKNLVLVLLLRNFVFQHERIRLLFLLMDPSLHTLHSSCEILNQMRRSRTLLVVANKS